MNVICYFINWTFALSENWCTITINQVGIGEFLSKDYKFHFKKAQCLTYSTFDLQFSFVHKVIYMLSILVSLANFFCLSIIVNTIPIFLMHCFK